MSSGKASPQSLLQGIKKTKSGRATTSRYAAEEVGGGGGGGGGDVGRGGVGGRPPRSGRGGTLHLHYVFIMLGIYFSTCFLIVYLFPLQEVEDEVEDEGELPSF